MTRKLMLLLVCGIVVFGSTVALKKSLSNDRRRDAARKEPSARFEVASDEADSLDELDPPARTKARAGVRQSATLRQRFVELATERAKRMSEEELGQAVEQITKQIADQDTAAEAVLAEAFEQLKSVAEKFPGTPSAERANRALEAMNAKPAKGSRSPRSVPEYRSPGNLEDADEVEADPLRDRNS